MPRPGRIRSACLLALALGAMTAGSAFAADPEPVVLPGVPGAEAEPNGDAASASPIASGTRIRGTLLSAADSDYFRFAGSAGELVFANVVTATSAGDSTDTELSLYDADGASLIEFDDDNGSQLGSASSIAGATLPADGTYFLGVAKAGGASALSYDLYLQLHAGTLPAEVEPNNTPATAGSLGDGAVAGARDPAEAGEDDYFVLQLQAGDTVFLSLDLDPERDGTAWNGRLGFGLAGDLDDSLLAVDDAGAAEDPAPTFPSEAFTMTVSQSGTYYAYVDAASGAVGGPTATYRLSAAVLPASLPSCRTFKSSPSEPVPDGETAVFDIPVDEELGAIERAAIRLDLTHARMTDLDVSVRNPAGLEVPLFSDIGADSPGEEAHMEALFDDFAAVPSAYKSLRPLMVRPDAGVSLKWPSGAQVEGQWALIVRDDTVNGNVGVLTQAELVLCTDPPTPTGPGSKPAAPTSATPIVALGPTEAAALRISPSAFRAATNGPAATANRASRGTTLSFRQPQPSVGSFKVLRASAGHRVAGECKRGAPANDSTRECVIFVRVGRFTRSADAGLVSFRLTGRLGGRTLPPDRYRIELTAYSAGREPSLPLRAGFRILPDD